MSVFELDLEIDEGADFVFVTDPWLVDGAPKDLTNATARLMARPRTDSTVVLVNLTSTPGPGGSIVPNGTDGTVTITIAHAATAALPGEWGPPRYDAFIDFQDGTSTKLLSGRLLVTPSCTR